MKAPDVLHLVEAALYAPDLARAEWFYREILGLPLLIKEIPRHLFFRAGEGMLLIFNPSETVNSTHLPPHGASGPGHAALGIQREDLQIWRDHLAAKEIPIEKAIHWPAGGESLYVRDPAGNSVELITKGCWGLPSGW